jgi:hypothetical protein
MANATYVSGSVAVTTAASKILTVPAENDGVTVQTGSVAVVFGGPGVTATTGISVNASTIATFPSVGGVVHDLYAVAASATSITYLYPAP